jgi:hypothetical protein
VCTGQGGFQEKHHKQENREMIHLIVSVRSFKIESPKETREQPVQGRKHDEGVETKGKHKPCASRVSAVKPLKKHRVRQ